MQLTCFIYFTQAGSRCAISRRAQEVVLKVSATLAGVRIEVGQMFADSLAFQDLLKLSDIIF